MSVMRKTQGSRYIWSPCQTANRDDRTKFRKSQRIDRIHHAYEAGSERGRVVRPDGLIHPDPTLSHCSFWLGSLTFALRPQQLIFFGGG